MPIYAYRCDECGFAKDVLQKISDEPLTECPSCGKSAFKKQVTAAGFQLKGSGWYVTDFRGGTGSAATTGTAAPAVASTESGASEAASTPAAPATPTAPAAPAPASSSD
ncbi:FmdB family zinc ribbon protein [Undibacterium sp. SXout20W]|uniref:FmdB family zinc ribbon protein n=1 Tax=Undibacterium sp. SXout20W TaxID=3413051 RepID=UPI003BF0B3FC